MAKTIVESCQNLTQNLVLRRGHQGSLVFLEGSNSLSDQGPILFGLFSSNKLVNGRGDTFFCDAAVSLLLEQYLHVLHSDFQPHCNMLWTLWNTKAR